MEDSFPFVFLVAVVNATQWFDINSPFLFSFSGKGTSKNRIPVKFKESFPFFFPEYVYLPPDSGKSMPTGLKSTSSPIQISASLTESAANTFTFDEIPLTLNVLDNEVFVVTQINLDVDAPDLQLGVDSATVATISTTERTSIGNIGNSNVMASAQREIVAVLLPNPAAVAFEREDPLFVAQEMDYLAIVATNNMFLNIEGQANTNQKRVRVRVYGYRATASSSTYAALVQSELLSA